jgi:hypothetical protein
VVLSAVLIEMAPSQQQQPTTFIPLHPQQLGATCLSPSHTSNLSIALEWFSAGLNHFPWACDALPEVCCCLQSDLLDAATRGDVATVQRCLAAGVSTQCKDEVRASLGCFHCGSACLYQS